MAPFSPLVKKDLRDSFYKGFLLENKTRPFSIKNKNRVRLKKGDDK